MILDTALIVLFYVIPMILIPVQIYVRYREEKAYVEANRSHYGAFDPHQRSALTYGEVLFLMAVALVPVVNIAMCIATAMTHPPQFLRAKVVKIPVADDNQNDNQNDNDPSDDESNA
jgi:hypothetical protein